MPLVTASKLNSAVTGNECRQGLIPLWTVVNTIVQYLATRYIAPTFRLD